MSESEAAQAAISKTCPRCGAAIKHKERDAEVGTRFVWINYECGSWAEYARREHRWHLDDWTQRCEVKP